MRSCLVLLLAATISAAAPNLKPEKPKPDEPIVVGTHLFTWGGTEVVVIRIEDVEYWPGHFVRFCYFREVRSGADGIEAYGPKTLAETARMRREAKQLPWDHPDY